MHKGSNIKLRKIIWHQSKKQKKFKKSTTRSDDKYGKTRLRQNLYGFKKENIQTYDRQHKENSKKTQISLKNRTVNCKKLNISWNKVQHNSKIKQEHT